MDIRYGYRFNFFYLDLNYIYRIQPNYRLGFSKMLGKLVVKYVPTYAKATLKKNCEGFVK